FARRLAPLLGCLLAACSVQTNSQENTMGLDPATAAYQEYGYNDRPVEARLGPHRYPIPANYFRDQIGPDFQGNFSLLLQWPDLKPLPPGERSRQDMETFAKQITISPDYIDRVPMEGLLEKSIQSHSAKDSLAYQNPRERLDLRDAQAPVFGLVPYHVNHDRLAAYEKQQEQVFGFPSNARLEDTWDWYVARDAKGAVSTVSKCDSLLQHDGFIIQGERVIREG